MPSKDPEKRREVRKRYRERHRDLVRQRQAIQRQAVKANPLRKPCLIEGCLELGERHHPDYSKPKEIVWLCKTHHEEEHHQRSSKCTICGDKVRARGFCNRHWKSERKKADPEFRKRETMQKRGYYKKKNPLALSSVSLINKK